MAYSRLPDHNWVLISVLPASSIQAVVASASLNVLGTIVLASVLYMVLALIWSRYFQADAGRDLHRDPGQPDPA